jgi:hypothetical protein
MEVPKFGSFKPKTKAISAEIEGSSSKEKEKSSERSSSHRVEKRHHSRDHNRQHRRHEDEDRDKRRRRDDRDHHRTQHERHKVRDNEPILKRKQDHPIPISQDEFEESPLFIIDRRGDSKNIEYGSLHRYSIPAYRRTGYGNLIGHPLTSKIDREASTEKEIFLQDASFGKRTHEKSSKLLSSKYGRNSETRLRFISAAAVPNGEGEEANDFIELSSSRKRKRGTPSPERDGGVDYRSIEGKAKASTRPADEDVEYAASDSDDAGYQNLDLRARQESALLSKQAKATPTNLEPWLKLSEHQSQLIRPGAEISSFTTSERTTLAELCLGILNEASKHIPPGKTDRENLLLAIIEAGVPLWDKTKLSAKWKDVLKECPSSILLWTKYIDHIQFSHSDFQYETCRDTYLQWLQIVATASSNSHTADEKAQVAQTQLYALLRFTSFVRDAGYAELATAIWQVLLEFHFFPPKDLTESSAETRLQSLEEYWDAETPRLGEANSLTWTGFHECGGSDAPPRTPAQISAVNIDAKESPSSLVQAEKQFDEKFWLPASMEDEDAVTDPFRCVMFDDLKSVLQSLSMEIPEDGLIAAFLQFAGLPPLPDGYPAARDWGKDPHLAHRGSGDDAIKMRSRQETTFSLFESAFQPFQTRHGSESAEEHEFAAFIDRTLSSLLNTPNQQNQNDDRLKEYYLAFKATCFPAEAPKAAKRLLKTRPTSLRLYNAFALIEAKAGRLEKALGVWSAALGMLPRLDEGVREEGVVLWHSRFHTLLLESEEKVALRTLLAISDEGSEAKVEEEEGNHIPHLRLRRFLETGFDQMLLKGRSEYAVLHADLLAWLSYLTSDITSALTSYNSHLATLSRSSTHEAVEALHQHKSHLLTYHITRHRPYKPSAFFLEITNALQIFPSNSDLLDLHSRLASQDRLRNLVSETRLLSRGKEEVGIVEWSYALNADISRWQDMNIGGGTVNTVRATFAAALLSPGSSVAHSVGLWEAWLSFERERGEEGRARGVVLDGLRAR